MKQIETSPKFSANPLFKHTCHSSFEVILQQRFDAKEQVCRLAVKSTFGPPIQSQNLANAFTVKQGPAANFHHVFFLCLLNHFLWRILYIVCSIHIFIFMWNQLLTIQQTNHVVVDIIGRTFLFLFLFLWLGLFWYKTCCNPVLFLFVCPSLNRTDESVLEFNLCKLLFTHLQ